jgi:hypothetical protein
MANKVYASPGVYTSEKDLTFTTETIGVTTLGLVGETKKGPAFQPMFIRNYDEFKLSFGGTSPEKFKNTQIVKYELPYIAKSYLGQSNQLYVTRVLGLSGYEGGMSYAIRTIGSVDKTTLEYTSTDTTFNFEVDITSGTLGLFQVSGTSTELIDHIATLSGVDSTKFDTAYNRFFTTLNYTTKDWYKNNAFYWGILDSTEVADLTVDRNAASLTGVGPVNPTFVDSYELPIGIPTSDRTDNILINEFSYDETTDAYTGYGFALYNYNIGTAGPTTVTGTTTLRTYEFTATPNAKYHKKLVATLKSRGSYIVNNLGFHVDSTTVGYDQFTAAESNPFATFDITGSTTGATDFVYSVSLDKTKKNYIKNVLGTTASDKDTYLFVEDMYDSILKKGWTFGEIKGLHYELLPVNNWDHYKFQFQSPATPFFVSELRGGLPQRLFRFISISDGGNANTEIKVSIGNVDLDKKTFDVYLRAFGDSDKAPVYLERFLGVSMDETADNYIGRKIGTIDNKYPLKSSYIVAEMAENAPMDGVASGFEGYDFRAAGTGSTDASYIGVPELPYKTKYYAPGELIVNPPFALPIYSTGDKVRKVFLGFTDTEYGFDKDLLFFKGKRAASPGDNMYNDGLDWDTKTKGFHMDVNAAMIVDTNGNVVFSTHPTATFTDPVLIASTPTHPYYDMKTRKFTALFAGGFDGWDIYRDQRTNTDEYKIGRTGFVQSGFDTFTSVEYNDTFGTSDYYATIYGIKTFENPEQTTINILATPGIDIINNTDLVRDTIEIVEEKRMDSIYLPTLPDMKLIGNSNPSNSEDWFYPADIIDELTATEIDSNYTAIYYPWIQISDVENNANVFIPPTAEVVKNLAFTDNVAHPWFATAGYNRGLVSCIRARIQLDQESRDMLYPGRINPIATFSDVGTVIWGNRNLQVKDSAMNRLNIRRLLLQARKLIVAVANRLLFDPNDAQVRSQFLSLVNPILDNIRKERGLTDFRVSLVNDIEDTDRNTLRGKIFIKPTPTLEFIELEFVVTPTSVSFDNL